MAAFVQAAKIKDGFLGKERREPQRNKMKDVHGDLGCRKVERVRSRYSSCFFRGIFCASGVQPVYMYGKSRMLVCSVKRMLEMEPRIALFGFSDLYRFLS